ncbi:MAG: hypothetical protein DWQ37_02810 [Planctomycetota bacterium]|nr:MAG: hypothetical protein DWQ37_02810 [Planctomycetota bacterium]
MKDHLLTIVLTMTTTIALVKLTDEHPSPRELEVDRLIVRKELIVSDTGEKWEAGYEAQEIPRGLYARTLSDGVAGLWVRSRIIKCELDDPFDDRFHALERNGQLRGVPGHISWNAWLDGAWRQMAIVQGEGLDPSEVPPERWNGSTHPGRLRFQSFRPGHDEPLTDAVLGQGMMSLGGGGYGGGGLPFPDEVLQLWGGQLRETPVTAPEAPRVVSDDGSGPHRYALLAVGPQGRRSEASPSTTAAGLATLAWDSVAGADSYVVLRDDRPVATLRIEGSQKQWTDRGPNDSQ